MTENTGEPKNKFEIVEEYRRRKLHEGSDLGENASLKELQAEYMRISQQRWEYACLYQGYDTYCSSRNMTVDEAKAAFFSVGENSEGENVAVAEIEGKRPDNLSGRINVIGADSLKMVREVNTAGGRSVGSRNALNSKDKLAHCARTAACNLLATANIAGLVDPIAGGETACAKTIHGGDGRKAICNDKYSNTSRTKTLQELVIAGDVGPGSIISVHTGNSGSGYHALTIASINRDEQGNIVSYSVMDNNGGDDKTRLRVIDINNTDGIAGKRVLYTNTEKWAMDQYRAQMEGKSEEELRAMIEDAKNETEVLIYNLAEKENFLLTDTNYTKHCGIGRVYGLKNQQRKLVEYYDKQVDIAQLGIAGFDIEAQKDLNTQLSEEVGKKEADLSEFTERYDACEENLTALAQREDELSQSVGDVNTQAMTGREERPKRYERRMGRYQNIIGEYNNLNEDYGTELASINADISTAQGNYDCNMQNIADCNESIEQLKQRNAELQEEVKGKTDPSSKIEGTNEILSNEQSIGENIQAKGASIEGVGANVTDMEGLAERKGENISAQEEVVANYQMVVDYATLSRREIKEKYGITPRELRERLDDLEAGEELSIEAGDKANSNEEFSYTEEEIDDVEEKMEEQRNNAEEQYQQNASEIASGEYGNDEIGIKLNVAERQEGTSSLGDKNPAQGEQTLEVEQTVEREKTPAELKKITKMQGWFSRVKIDPALVDSMVEKYGVDVAYDLALKSMTEPYNVSQGVGTNFMNSKKCINYFLDNEVSDEVIARVTGREVASPDLVRPGDRFTFHTGQGNTSVGMER